MNTYISYLSLKRYPRNPRYPSFFCIYSNMKKAMVLGLGYLGFRDGDWEI